MQPNIGYRFATDARESDTPPHPTQRIGCASDGSGFDARRLHKN